MHQFGLVNLLVNFGVNPMNGNEIICVSKFLLPNMSIIKGNAVTYMLIVVFISNIRHFMTKYLN